jgi:hypothetical protein
LWFVFAAWPGGQGKVLAAIVKETFERARSEETWPQRRIEEGDMKERGLKVVLVVVGLVFLAGMYPLIAFFTKEPGVPMIMSIYVTLGVFLLVAARDPAANRNLIAFAGWANIAHAGVMAVQEYVHAIGREELPGVVVFGIVGIVLVAMAPRKAGREVAAEATD